MQLGKYQLVRKLATGGMAEVYLAKAAGPMGFEKTLVLKRILPHLAEDPAFVEMFLGEAKLAAQLEHPNVVQIFDFGEAEGSFFLAMELIDGPNLRKLVKRAQAEPLPPALCAKLVAFAAEGLAYAHDFRDSATGEPLGLIHRDVSPDNILVSRQGAVKVVDFGIAKVAGQSHRTQTGVVKGKVAYMPPEQLQTKPLDRRVDVYALGVVLYELLTGKRPFDATTDVSVMQAILFEAFIPATQRRPDLPGALQQVLDRALEKDREKRYPDCRALQADLERFIMSTGESVGAYQIAQFVGQWMVETGGAQVGGTPPRSATPRGAFGTGPKPETARKSMEVPVDSTSPTTPMPIAMRSAVRELPPAPPVERAPERSTMKELAAESPASRSTVQERAVPSPSERSTVQERAVQTPSRIRGEERATQPMPGLAAVGKRQSGASWKAPPDVVMAPTTPMPAITSQSASADAGAQEDSEDGVHTRSAELTAPGARKKPGMLVAAAVGGVLLTVGGGFALFGTDSGSKKAVPVEVEPLPPGKVKDTASSGDGARAAEARPAEQGSAVREAASTEAPAIAAAPAVAPAAPSESTKPAGGVPPPSEVKPASDTAAPEGKSEAPPASEPAKTPVVEKKRTAPAVQRPRPAAKGTLELRIRPYAIVSLDGKVLGQTPLAPVEVSVGRHTLRLVNKELGKDVTRTIEVKAGEPNMFKLNLEVE
ncbi:serine/threonine-protein kinase [Myxococcus sp. RHSTA-1-4]|uniref:serine/threonine-protein kinase n=1 Tax=Myxococcus sp. RHSTA-1-4 TaxID=2874601 RepID=UPI001CBE3B18|nr:serine/threonine-protein kinase [Myxococcus sp. RHSTA-1-4]MBZ4417063.1 protein kinase [Myxococcus sp. RHSTA-1-4]